MATQDNTGTRNYPDAGGDAKVLKRKHGESPSERLKGQQVYLKMNAFAFFLDMRWYGRGFP